jgi:hypothetical protein
VGAPLPIVDETEAEFIWKIRCEIDEIAGTYADLADETALLNSAK